MHVMHIFPGVFDLFVSVILAWPESDRVVDPMFWMLAKTSMTVTYLTPLAPTGAAPALRSSVPPFQGVPTQGFRRPWPDGADF